MRNDILDEMTDDHLMRNTRRSAHYAYRSWERLRDATTTIDTAYATRQLSEAMSELVTWLPEWDYETGTLHDEC